MPLQFEVDSLDGLDENVSSLYSKDEKSGKFRLGIDGLPQPEDTTGLKNKVEELLREKKEAERIRKEAEAAAKKAAEEAARKAGDTEALERSWSEKMNTAVSEKDAEVKRVTGALHTLLVDNVATVMAGEIALQGSAGVLVPHIKSRLSVDMVDGKYVTKVLDAAGRPSAMTVDELKKEFIGNPAFAPVIVGSKATGGGAGGGKGGGAAKHGGDLSKMTREEKMAYFRDKAESA